MYTFLISRNSQLVKGMSKSANHLKTVVVSVVMVSVERKNAKFHQDRGRQLRGEDA